MHIKENFELIYFIIILAVLVLLILIASLVIFFKIFYSPKRKPIAPDEYVTPRGRIYEPYREQMIEWMREMRSTEHSDVEIRSYDGLRLVGKYYEQKKGAPIEIMFHGYKSTAERDLCGGMQRCFKVGRNALIVEQILSKCNDKQL